MSTANKLAVLQKIKQEKSVLFGPFSNDLTKQKKCEKWKEVTDLAESLGLVTGKPWQYFRDTLWSNWRKRTLAKRNSAKMAGGDGGKEVKYNEMDLLILDILGKDNPSVEGLDGNDCFQAEETVEDQQQAQLPTSVLPTDIPPPSSVTDEKRSVKKGKRWLTRWPEKHLIYQAVEEKKRKKLDLEIQHLELLNYKLKLQALELERKLYLPRSDYTRDLRGQRTH